LGCYSAFGIFNERTREIFFSFFFFFFFFFYRPRADRETKSSVDVSVPRACRVFRDDLISPDGRE